jgi:hypothetical protein
MTGTCRMLRQHFLMPSAEASPCGEHYIAVTAPKGPNGILVGAVAGLPRFLADCHPEVWIWAYKWTGKVPWMLPPTERPRWQRRGGALSLVGSYVQGGVGIVFGRA